MAHVSLERARLNVYLPAVLGRRIGAIRCKTNWSHDTWERFGSKLSHDFLLVIVHCKNLPSLGIEYAVVIELRDRLVPTAGIKPPSSTGEFARRDNSIPPHVKFD